MSELDECYADYEALNNRYHAAHREIARLTKANAELRQLAHDAVGPTVAWASEYQTRYELDNPHPQHQELIDRLLSAANGSEGE